MKAACRGQNSEYFTACASAAEMTYIVLGGALNSILTHYACAAVFLWLTLVIANAACNCAC